MRRVRLTLRAGISVYAPLTVLAVAAVLPIVGGALLPGHAQRDWADAPLTFRAVRGDLVDEVDAKGTLESAENVDVCCDVSVPGFYFTRILELVPEGTFVQPGDFLVRLDSAPLEELLTEQRIDCFTSEALLSHSQRTWDKAVAARNEYLEGTYRQQKEILEAALVVATEMHRRAEEHSQQSRRLYSKGYVTQRELEADEFAAHKEQLDLDLAKTRLEGLIKYTRLKRVKDLECDVLSAAARLKAARFRYERDLEQLAELEEKIAACWITAPTAGQVVYAHLHHHGHSHMIEEGAQLWRNQTIIRLPNPKRMQIKAEIREDRVAAVEVGMPVRVRLEAYPGAELTGRVAKVNEYPEPVSWVGSSVKEFETIIALDESELDLRPGLSAEIQIRVNEVPDQLLVPVQAVLAHEGKDYCLTCDGARLRARQVEIGSSDGNYVVIREGLDEGNRVVLGTDAHRDEVGLPKSDRDS